MNKTVTIVLAVAALAASLPLVVAGSFNNEPVTAADALPAYEIVTTVRAMGLNPISDAVRRGPYYVLHAYDPAGVELRVVADAQFGDILSVTPAHALEGAYAPSYERGPRIIHVPRRGEPRASIGDRREIAPPEDDDVEVAPPPPPPPPPRRHVTAPPQRRSHVTPPAAQQRKVLSAPPPRPTALTPIYPTPQFNTKADKAEKFEPPKDEPAAANAATPPRGYTPPAALPQSD